MLNVTVRPFLDDVRKDLRRVSGPISDRAAQRANVSAGRKIRTRSAQALRDKTGVPVRQARRRVLVTSKITARGFVVTALQHRVLASKLSRARPRQNESGTRVGKFTFPGAFAATMESGHTSAFKRTTRKRLPIREEGIALSPHIERIVPEVIDGPGRREFKRTFERNMARRLRRAR